MRPITKKLLLSSAIAALSMGAQANDLRINGFMSTGISIVDNDEITIEGNDDTASIDSNTIFALQLSQQVNDKFSLTGQLVSRGDEQYETEAAWAYASYTPTDTTTVRAGRVRVPFFYYSDFLEVGYAYNWSTPPTQVYRIPFSSIDGIDLVQEFSFGDITGSGQVYYGRYKGDILDITFDVKDFMGAVLNLSWNSLSYRASYHQAKLNAEPDLSALPALPGLAEAFEIDEDTSTFIETALVWDDGSNIAIAEYTTLEHDSASLSDDTAWLVSYGRRIGDFVVTATYTEQENDYETDYIGIPTGAPAPNDIYDSSVGDFQKGNDSQEKTVGYIASVRYDIAASTAVKFEAHHKVNTVTQFYGAGSPLAGLPTGETEEQDGTLFKITVDMVF